MSPEIILLMLFLLCVKLALKHAAYAAPVQPTRKTRSDKGTRRVKPLPYDYARESVQSFE